MKGIRFYEELNDKGTRRETSRGTVFAAFIGQGHMGATRDWIEEGVGSVEDRPNSPVCGTGASREYLAHHCRHISEARAREIHPALFQYLDTNLEAA